MNSKGKLDYDEFKRKMVSRLVISQGWKGWKLKSGTRRHADHGKITLDFSILEDVDRVAAAVIQDYMERRPQLFLNLIRDVLKLEDRKRVAVRIDFGLGFETICLLEGGICPKNIKKMSSISVELVIAPDSSEIAADGILSRRNKYTRVPCDEPLCKYLMNLDYDKMCIYIHERPEKEKYEGTEWHGDSSGKKRVLRLFTANDSPNLIATGHRMPEFEQCILNGTRPVRKKLAVEFVGESDPEQTNHPEIDSDDDNPIFETEWFRRAGCGQLKEDILSSRQSSEPKQEKEDSKQPASSSNPKEFTGQVSVVEGDSTEKIRMPAPESKQGHVSEKSAPKPQGIVKRDVQAKADPATPATPTTETSPASRDFSRNRKECGPDASRTAIPGNSVARASSSKTKRSGPGVAPTLTTATQESSTSRQGETAVKATKRDRASLSDNGLHLQPQSKQQKQVEHSNNVAQDQKRTDFLNSCREKKSKEEQNRKNLSTGGVHQHSETGPAPQQDTKSASQGDVPQDDKDLEKEKKRKREKKERKKAKKEAKKKAKKDKRRQGVE